VSLDGPQGPGTGSIVVTVSAPGAIPVWLGWLIGLSPLVGLAWFGLAQRRHWRRTPSQQSGETAAPVV
jgi:hypothetical protein